MCRVLEPSKRLAFTNAFWERDNCCSDDTHRVLNAGGRGGDQGGWWAHKAQDFDAGESALCHLSSVLLLYICCFLLLSSFL